MVTKFSPDGKVLMVLGRRPPAVDGAQAVPRRPEPAGAEVYFLPPDGCRLGPAGQHLRLRWLLQQPRREIRQERPLPGAGGQREGGQGAGRIQSAARLAGGRHRATSGSPTARNIRYQVLDNNLKPIREITNLGVGWTVCISPGPHQYVFLSNSNPNGNLPGSWDITGEIYKAELDGTVLGKFGHPGKLAARIPGGPHDGLPQSERDHRWAKSNPGGCRNSFFSPRLRRIGEGQRALTARSHQENTHENI